MINLRAQIVNLAAQVDQLEQTLTRWVLPILAALEAIQRTQQAQDERLARIEQGIDRVTSALPPPLLSASGQQVQPRLASREDVAEVVELATSTAHPPEVDGFGMSRTDGGARGDGARRNGAAWTREESDALLHAFDEGSCVRDLARRLGRTPGAIAARLVRLGRIEERRHAFVPAERAQYPAGLPQGPQARASSSTVSLQSDTPS